MWTDLVHLIMIQLNPLTVHGIILLVNSLNANFVKLRFVIFHLDEREEQIQKKRITTSEKKYY